MKGKKRRCRRCQHWQRDDTDAGICTALSASVNGLAITDWTVTGHTVRTRPDFGCTRFAKRKKAHHAH